MKETNLGGYGYVIQTEESGHLLTQRPETRKKKRR